MYNLNLAAVTVGNLFQTEFTKLKLIVHAFVPTINL